MQTVLKNKCHVLVKEKFVTNGTVARHWYSCTYKGCKFIGRTNAGLARHLKNHSSDRQYACGTCERRCKTLALLKEHRKVHSDSKPFWCLLCEYKCRNKANLKSHLRAHSDERPHACHMCNYKSKTFGNLKNHLRKHTGEKPFSCPACSYRCSTQGSLNVHLRVHTGEKPYLCSNCSYKSATSGGLKSHYRIHSTNAPFKCDECPKSFDRLSLLRNHRNSHVKDTNFRCSSCSFQSNDPEQIRDHIAKHADSGKPKDPRAPKRVPHNQRKDSISCCLRRDTTRKLDFPANERGAFQQGSDESSTSSESSSGIHRFQTFNADSDSIKFSEICSVRCEPLRSSSFFQNFVCIYCKRYFQDMEALTEHLPSHSTELKIDTFNVSNGALPVFSLPFTFLDRLFPPNHLHERYWNETGADSKFSGYFSMFLGTEVDFMKNL